MGRATSHVTQEDLHSAEGPTTLFLACPREGHWLHPCFPDGEQARDLVQVTQHVNGTAGIQIWIWTQVLCSSAGPSIGSNHLASICWIYEAPILGTRDPVMDKTEILFCSFINSTNIYWAPTMCQELENWKRNRPAGNHFIIHTPHLMLCCVGLCKTWGSRELPCF